jgi:hypothetical protein
LAYRGGPPGTPPNPSVDHLIVHDGQLWTISVVVPAADAASLDETADRVAGSIALP